MRGKKAKLIKKYCTYISAAERHSVEKAKNYYRNFKRNYTRYA